MTSSGPEHSAIAVQQALSGGMVVMSRELFFGGQGPPSLACVTMQFIQLLGRKASCCGLDWWWQHTVEHTTTYSHAFTVNAVK